MLTIGKIAVFASLLAVSSIGIVRANLVNLHSPASPSRLSLQNNQRLPTPRPVPQVNKNDLLDAADLRSRSRNIAIFTTASLPWLTGTSINPLLRAIYLEKAAQKHKVTLCIPFISEEQQRKLHPKHVFPTPRDQEDFVRNWAMEKHGHKTNIQISFYPAKFIDSIGSIIATGDMTHCVPEAERDVAVLEEPEHLNWFHTGNKWCDVFNYVVGVVHTKYLFYRSRDAHISPALRPAWTYGWEMLNAWVARAYCHHVIKLSDAVQDFSNAVTCNVHGVRDSFRQIGLDFAKRPSSPRFKKGACYIGKVLWSKGYRELVDKMKMFRDATGVNLPVDCYGSGPDLEEIQAETERLGLDFKFFGAIDHADPSLQEYKILINPSLSDVVCTTSAEALAMGKFLLCPEHPSNEFFTQFSNTAVYNHDDDASFVRSLQGMVDHDPARMTKDESWKLSWESATERFYDASAECVREQQSPADKVLATAHGVAAAGLRRSFGIEAKEATSPAKAEPAQAEAVKKLDDVGRKIIFGASLLGGLSAATSGLRDSGKAPVASVPRDVDVNLHPSLAPHVSSHSPRVAAVATQLPPSSLPGLGDNMNRKDILGLRTASSA